MEILTTGSRLVLRRVVSEDASGPYLRWMNDAEITQFLESRFRSYTVEDLKAYIETVNHDSANVFCAMVLKESGRHIGNIKLGPIHPFHQSGDIGLMVGEKDCWGKGYATEAIALIRDYAFETLGLVKLTAGCYGNNMGSANAFLKCGFSIEGRRPMQYRSGDHWVDSILMGMMNPVHALKNSASSTSFETVDRNR